NPEAADRQNAGRQEEGPMPETMTKRRVRIDPVKLERFVTDVLVGLDMPPADAAVTARGLVLADLRGHESHGVSNALMGGYIPGLKAGDINPRPEVRIIQETHVIARWDGDRGLGFVVGEHVMQ